MDIILELLNRKRLIATLANPFIPENDEVTVIIQGSKELQKFLFSEICCIFMKPDQNRMFEIKSDTLQEEVTTVIGNIYQVNVSDKQSYPTGFFGLLVNRDNPYRLIFFTKLGVKTRCQRRVVGEILQSKGMVTPDLIQDALKEQQRLKNRLLGEIICDNNKIPHASVERAFELAKAEGKILRGIKIGEILIAAGLVTKEQVQTALVNQQGNRNKKLGELLIKDGFISEEQLLQALATKFQMQIIDLSNVIPNMKALEALPEHIVRRLHVFPIMDKGDQIVVATSEPNDLNISDQLRFYTHRNIEMVIASSTQITAAIEKYYAEARGVVNDSLGKLALDQEVDQETETEGIEYSESDSQIVNIVNTILFDAYRKRASDIHFEPDVQDQPCRIRYRIDGICSVVNQIPKIYKKAIISRLKIMANLDITERRKPQSGKIYLKFQSEKVEYRIEVLPTTGNNEAAVIRILPPSRLWPLDEMDFSDSNLEAFKNLLSQPNGIILCVGPTGSGKTTTLHSALGYINTPDRKIWTAEDPVEITQPGLQQVQIQSKIGLTFAEVLRSFLRADPDVIMIGEMRDQETAKTAIEASLTGHLVLSTLHTNSAPETIVRLIEMGMDPFNFSDAFLGILAQRLTRRLCDRCKKPYHPSEDEFSNYVRLYNSEWYKEHHMMPYSSEMLLMKKEGCEECSGTGYRGRIALHELVVGTKKLKEAIKKGTYVEELKMLAMQEGMRTLIMDGVQKIFRGLTDLSQVLKVCSTQVGSVS